MHRGKKKEKTNTKIWLLKIFQVVSNIASLLLNKTSPEAGDENQRNDYSRQKRHMSFNLLSFVMSLFFKALGFQSC